MRTNVYLFTFILLLIPKVLLSQDSENKGSTIYKKNQIGIQFNPYFNEQFFNFITMNTVSALRYGYRITNNITTGMEFSCNFPINVRSSQSFHYFYYKIGLLTRYSIRPDKRLQLFGEASPYYSHVSGKGINAFNFNVSQFGAYIAPGASLYSKNKKFSFDLYFKFSNLPFINGKKFVLSYKVNYNF